MIAKNDTVKPKPVFKDPETERQDQKAQAADLLVGEALPYSNGPAQ